MHFCRVLTGHAFVESNYYYSVSSTEQLVVTVPWNRGLVFDSVLFLVDSLSPKPMTANWTDYGSIYDISWRFPKIIQRGKLFVVSTTQKNRGSCVLHSRYPWPQELSVRSLYCLDIDDGKYLRSRLSPRSHVLRAQDFYFQIVFAKWWPKICNIGFFTSHWVFLCSP